VGSNGEWDESMPPRKHDVHHWQQLNPVTAYTPRPRAVHVCVWSRPPSLHARYAYVMAGDYGGAGDAHARRTAAALQRRAALGASWCVCSQRMT
jgi:hypothetical protein